MKRGGPLRRTPMKRGQPLRSRSERAQAQQDERARRMREAFGHGPVPCAGAGILPPCPRWEHGDTVPHEPRKRSQGADPTDPAQAMPLCFDGHRWVHDHPAMASQLHTRDGRAFLILSA